MTLLLRLGAVTFPRRVLILAASLLLAACPRPRDAARPVEFGPITDAPWELEDDTDWAEVRDQMLALAPTDRRRRDLRIQLAAAQAGRITRWLDANRPNLAYEALLELARLFADDPDAIGADLTGQKEQIARARAVFARAGADQEVVLALVVLGEIEPEQRDAHWAEIDEVLSFADELAIAENGPSAIRGRPIQVLEPIALALPLRKVTDRFAELVTARQVAVSDALENQGASFELVRAHGDVLRAARALAAALARGGRADEIDDRIKDLAGIGADEDLAARAVAAGRDGATAKDWLLFAREFRSRDEREDDPATARAICMGGLARFPGDAGLLAAAADASVDLERVHEPIRLLEELAAGGAGGADVAEQLAGLYRARLAALAFNDRPLEAQRRLDELEAYVAAAGKQHPNRAWKRSLAEAYATVGRGMVSQGELDEAVALLQKSVKLHADPEAYEMLATVASKRGQCGEARAFAERGVEIDDPSGAGRYLRAKLLKLSGDAAKCLGDVDSPNGARDRWMVALSIWADLGDASQLPPALAGERLVQAGQLLYALGQTEDGLGLIDASVDVDPDGADTHTQAVAFLIVQDEYARALDAYHRAVIADRIGDYHKVYMSLWVLAEARRRGVEPDPLALEFLQGRDGALWHDEMARLATGRVTVAELERRAATRGRKAELAYYTAVLGLGPEGAARPDKEVRALLEHVVETDMILFFEYEMARHWLAAQ
jgi:tetratricopeptide (TPR) repeat protein